ncbi:asparaginase [Halobacteriales archaeon QS_9_70_65]|nr:MAG: asparaginase [Halobacteriales archaeon QS_9_70_65]
MRVIAHGGAGTPPEEPADRQTALDEAAAAGAAAATPTDAVVATLRALESDPRFNAGVGGAVQSDGHVRTDAGLMTDDREVGAVAGMPGVEHAVDVARVVKERTPHVLVTGVHAVDLAAAAGVEAGVDLRTDETDRRWADVDAPDGDPLAHADWVRERFGDRLAAAPDADADSEAETGANGRDRDHDHDTVGAVATDGDRVAAATSTGGRWLALAGRVGDVPQVGSGFYCTPAGGASATGAGEDIARTTLSRRAVDRLADGAEAQAAAEAAIEEFGGLVEGSAGVILMTPDGDAGAAYDSAAMQTAVVGDR